MGQDIREAVGLDLGDEFSHLCRIDMATGEVLGRGRVPTRREELRRALVGGSARVVLEVGTHSPWVSQELSELGHEVIVANARRLRMIYQGERKCDVLDAETLARVGRLDPRLLSPILHRGEKTQLDLALLRARHVLVRARSKLVNAARGMAKPFGVRLRTCSTKAFGRQVAGDVPRELRGALGPLLAEVESLSRRITALEKKLERRGRQAYPEVEAVWQPVGVGLITGMAFVLTIEDPWRFRRNRDVGPFLGLVPRRDQSGERDPSLGITKAGNPLLRSLLVQSAHYILGPRGPDCDLRRWGLGIAQRGGAHGKKRAVVATARRLAVLMLHLWKTGQRYESRRCEEVTT